MRRATGMVLAVVLAGGSSSLAAQGAFESADRDGDGAIGYGEYREHLQEVFFAADRDRNGRVSAQEQAKLRPGQFETADRNGDGAIDLVEGA